MTPQCRPKKRTSVSIGTESTPEAVDDTAEARGRRSVVDVARGRRLGGQRPRLTKWSNVRGRTPRRLAARCPGGTGDQRPGRCAAAPGISNRPPGPPRPTRPPGVHVGRPHGEQEAHGGLEVGRCGAGPRHKQTRFAVRAVAAAPGTERTQARPARAGRPPPP